MDIRSLEVVDFAKYEHLPIHIIGMGATGSRVFEQLIVMGCRHIHCYDFDKVESHNLHNQLWTYRDIGLPKVEAGVNWLNDKYGPNAYPDIHFHDQRAESEDVKAMKGIIFLLTDTFDSRREIIAAAAQGGNAALVIETRLGTVFNEVRAINPFDAADVKAFEQSLGNDDDDDAEVSACGTKINCALTAIGAATTAVWMLVNVFTKQPLEQSRINNTYQPLLQSASQ